MAESRTRFFSKLASNIDSAGGVTPEAIAPTVSLGAKIYSSRANLPTSGNTAGDQAFTTDTNRLYIWNGSGWYNVALLNVAPAISAVTDSDGGVTPFALAIDGTVTTITITAADSDGDPITYAASADSDFSGLATLSQADNVFTITPFGQDSATTSSGTITFTATDGINVASSGIQTFTLNFLSELWDETVLSIGTSSTNALANSTFIDRSTNAHTVTTSGTPVQTTFHPYLDNWSVEFDGDGDILKSPTSADFAFGTGDFTVEFWLLYRGGNGYRFFWNLNDAPDYIGYGLNIGTLTPWLWQDAIVALGNTNVTPNVWQHHAVVRESGVIKIYLDGIEIASAPYTTNISTNKLICIGGNGVNNTQDTNGIYSNFRVVKGTALYTANFTPPTEKLTAVSGTSLLTCQSNRFIDNSTNGHTITVNGNPEVSAFNPFGQGSEYAVGENKGSMTTNDDTSNFISFDRPAIGVSDDIALSFWVYITDDAYENWYTDTGATRFLLYGDANGTELELYVSSSSIITTTGLTKMEWHHVEVNRASGIWYLHVDGEHRGNTTTHGTTSFTASTQYIAYNSGSGTNTIKGYISDYYFSIGNALHTSISNFTPPTAPVGNSNADLYLPMDNAGIFDKTGNNTLTLTGSTATSTTQTKFADTSIYFDGSSDTIEIPNGTGNNPQLLFNNSNWTMEAWIYKTSAANANIFSQASVSSFVSSSDGKLQLQIYRGNNYVLFASAAGAISINTWHHVALTCDGSDYRIWVDGTQVATAGIHASYPWSQGVTTAPFVIGRYTFNNSNYWPGYIENIQLNPNVCKYTTTFTPPTQEQGRTYQAES